MDNHINFIEGGIPLGRVGRELKMQREENEILRMWSQIKYVAWGLVVYASLSSLWGQKVVYLALIVIALLIIGRLNKIN